jgi:hypothetical protein
MNANQNNVLTMCEDSSSALEEIMATPGCPAALAAAAGALKTTINEANAQAVLQAVPIKGRTKDRKAVFERSAKAALLVAGLVLAYANAKELHELAAKVRLKPYRFTHGRARRRIELAQQVHDAAVSVLPQLAPYNVDAATLVDLQTAIDDAKALLTAIRGAIAQRKLATENLEARLDAAHGLLKNEIDALVEATRDANPDAYKLYRSARMIVDLPGRPGEPAQPQPAADPAASPQASASVHPVAA